MHYFHKTSMRSALRRLTTLKAGSARTVDQAGSHSCHHTENQIPQETVQTEHLRNPGHHHLPPAPDVKNAHPKNQAAKVQTNAKISAYLQGLSKAKYSSALHLDIPLCSWSGHAHDKQQIDSITATSMQPNCCCCFYLPLACSRKFDCQTDTAANGCEWQDGSTVEGMS